MPGKKLTPVKKQAIRNLLSYVRQCDHGSRIHAAIEVLVASGCLVGTLRKIDLCDLDPKEGSITLRTAEKHAIPPQEYSASISEACIDAIQAYIEYERIETDGADSGALFTSPFGRVSNTTIRRSISQAAEETIEYHTIQSGDTCSEEQREQTRSLMPHEIRIYGLRQLHE